MRLSNLAYLTFEISKTCGLADLHPKCPVSDPERFKFGRQDYFLSDALIGAFWQWAVQEHGFRGVVLWHLYNEPAAENERIQKLVAWMRQLQPDQRTHLWTGKRGAAQLPGYDHVELTDYAIVRPDDLDNRRMTIFGNGNYDRVPSHGVCTRSFPYEIILDYHCNWILCCNDWRAEESVGNIAAIEGWDTLLDVYEQKARIHWSDKNSYEALPRMCRSCVELNPTLHRSGRVPA